MLSKCANPACQTPFQYLRDGKLFQFELPSHSGPQLVGGDRPVRKVEHFWLCGRCAATMTLAFERQHGMVVVPLKDHTIVRHAAAS
ncbi:MAG: hypothetical protein ACE14M_08935 [Terriglobales bacterium]